MPDRTVLKILEAPEGKRLQEYNSYQRRLNAVRLSPRNTLALRLYVAGVRIQEILKATGIASSEFSVLKASPVGQTYIKIVTKEFDEQFKLLFGKVIRYIDDGLESVDFQVRDRAAHLWASMSGKITHTLKVERTAEDM